ncbi:MAG: hypothetical protein IKK91_05440 [Ruminococcus sp.]|nr:hypothetical protein [Ruminococcus sp.]
MYWWRIRFYTTGGFLESVTVNANNKTEAILKVRKAYKVIEIYGIKYIG